jgi:hypothetical protein
MLNEMTSIFNEYDILHINLQGLNTSTECDVDFVNAK